MTPTEILAGLKLGLEIAKGLLRAHEKINSISPRNVVVNATTKRVVADVSRGMRKLEAARFELLKPEPDILLAEALVEEAYSLGVPKSLAVTTRGMLDAAQTNLVRSHTGGRYTAKRSAKKSAKRSFKAPSKVSSRKNTSSATKKAAKKLSPPRKSTAKKTGARK